MHPDRRHIKTKREGVAKGCFWKAGPRAWVASCSAPEAVCWRNLSSAAVCAACSCATWPASESAESCRAVLRVLSGPAPTSGSPVPVRLCLRTHTELPWLFGRACCLPCKTELSLTYMRMMI